MSDDRITDVPTPGNSRHVATGVPPALPAGDRLNLVALRPRPSPVVWMCVRVVGTAAVAAAFVYVCWLISGSVYPGPRELAGPVALLRTWGREDHFIGAVATLVLLPLIFAVGVRANAATVVLSILAGLCWVGFGLWIEAMASV